MTENVDTPQQPPAILSLCTGGGMLDDGLERAIGPVRTVAYVEIEAFCVWNLVAKMEAGLLAPAPVFTNLKTFPAKPFHGKIHGIIGGYPCQPFSHAGQRKGADDERHLFPHICRIIEAVEPLWCFFENVPGHLSMGYDEVYRSLRALGYRVEAGIYSAAEVGATHNRERLFILAFSDTECSDGEAGRKRMGWETRANINRCCAKSELGDSISSRQLQPERLIGNIRRWTDNASEAVGDTPQRENDRQPPRNMDAAQREGRCINPTAHDAGEAMGNTPNPRHENTRPAGIGQLPAQGSSRLHNRPQLNGDEQQMGNTISAGQQQSERSQPGRAQQPSAEYAGACFPAPPGHPQHAWEAPRVEPGLGFSIDGYNFREDLLRMAGNGVVPQTAAKAFKELCSKLNK